MIEQFRGRGLLMSILIVPLFISPVIVGQSWALFLQRPFGPTDYLLTRLLGHPVTISWLTRVALEFRRLIVIADAWQWTPFMFVILLAGLARFRGTSMRRPSWTASRRRGPSCTSRCRSSGR